MSKLTRTLQEVAWVRAQDSLVPHTAGTVPCAHSPLFKAHGIRHVFLGRSELAVEWQHVKQVHGTNIVAAGAGTAAQTEERTHADGVFTRQRGVCVAVKTADCVPILCCDREARRFALAVHAGRRGLLGGIVARAVSCLEAQGVRCDDSLWAIGPAIGMEAYEVSPVEMEAAHDEAVGLPAEQMALCFGKGQGDRWHLDLQLLAVLQLLHCGVSAAHLSVVRICTYKMAELFYSFRFDKQHLGSNWSYVALL